jgi:hypothetical protein
MNAAIQCLAHTPSLADFFLSNNYRGFLSEDAKIGDAFGSIVNNICRHGGSRHNYYSRMSDSPCSPSAFLEAFTRDGVAPQFAGGRQRTWVMCMCVSCSTALPTVLFH